MWALPVLAVIPSMSTGIVGASPRRACACRPTPRTSPPASAASRQPHAVHLPSRTTAHAPRTTHLPAYTCGARGPSSAALYPPFHHHHHPGAAFPQTPDALHGFLACHSYPQVLDLLGEISMDTRKQLEDAVKALEDEKDKEGAE